MRTTVAFVCCAFLAGIACGGAGDRPAPARVGLPGADGGADGGPNPNADGGTGKPDGSTGPDDLGMCTAATGDLLVLTDTTGTHSFVDALKLENGVDSAGFADEKRAHVITFGSGPAADGTFGDPLVVRAYPNASTLGSGHPILGYGGCNTVKGAFQIVELKRYGALITKLVAGFNLSCEQTMPVISGCIRYDHQTAATQETYAAKRIFGNASRACALTTTGELRCWGDGKLVPSLVTGLPANVTSVALGRAHACSLTQAGRVDCWGDNASGQLGNGDLSVTKSAAPVPVVGLSSGVVAIAAGDDHTCAINGAGSILCWGAAVNGQLGAGYSTPTVTPVALAGSPSNPTALSANGEHTCAVANGGHVTCWGSNDHGQLGNGTVAFSGTPSEIAGLSGVTAVSAGLFHTCALTGGTASCWGGNAAGSLGDGTMMDRSSPVPVMGLSGAKQLATGDVFSCALLTSGAAKCWGHNVNGELGAGKADFGSALPVNVVGLAGADSIAASVFSVCALVGTRVTCWGSNQFGELGDTTTHSNPKPIFDVATFP